MGENWKEESEARKKKIAEYLSQTKIHMKAVFVPFDRSRNANEDRVSLNWKIKLCAGKPEDVPERVLFETDYTQGIGHIPHYQHHHKTKYDAAEYRRYEKLVAQQGYYANVKSNPMASSVGTMRARTKLPDPDYVDVMYCLISDARVLDEGSFEDWASSL